MPLLPFLANHAHAHTSRAVESSTTTLAYHTLGLRLPQAAFWGLIIEQVISRFS